MTGTFFLTSFHIYMPYRCEISTNLIKWAPSFVNYCSIPESTFLYSSSSLNLIHDIFKITQVYYIRVNICRHLAIRKIHKLNNDTILSADIVRESIHIDLKHEYNWWLDMFVFIIGRKLIAFSSWENQQNGH